MICIWSNWCHCHPIISCFVKIQNGLPILFWCHLTQVVLENTLLNECCCVMELKYVVIKLWITLLAGCGEWEQFWWDKPTNDINVVTGCHRELYQGRILYEAGCFCESNIHSIVITYCITGASLWLVHIFYSYMGINSIHSAQYDL